MGTLPEYIGQKHILRQLRPIINGARKAARPLLHTLLLGMSGIGKSYLAEYICELYGLRKLKVLYRTEGITEVSIAVEAQSWQECDIVFVDETHRLAPRIQECLYRVMVERKAPRVETAFPSGKLEICGEVSIPQVALIAATDQPSLLLPAFKSRFGLTYTLRPYSLREMVGIVRRRAGESNLIITTQAAKQLAIACRGTPRFIRHRLEAIKDFYGISTSFEVTKAHVRRFLRKSGFDLRSGLSEDDQRYLLALGKVNGGPLALGSLTKILAIESDFLEAEIESYLFREGLVVITPSGRVLTEKGKQWIGGTAS